MKYIDRLAARYPALAPLKHKTEDAVRLLLTMYRAGGKLLLAGNGGSAADCEHISGELLKGFLLPRPAVGAEREALAAALGSPEQAARLQRGVPAVPLPSLSAVTTAFMNDVDPALVFAQQVYALARPGDVLLVLSTSGNSENILLAARVARAQGIPVIALTGAGGGRVGSLADITLDVPASSTPDVQEYHLPLYHAICAQVEEELFGHPAEA